MMVVTVSQAVEGGAITVDVKHSKIQPSLTVKDLERVKQMFSQALKMMANHALDNIKLPNEQ